MTAELKKRSIIYGAGVFIYVCAIATTTYNMDGGLGKFIWFLIAYLIIGYDVFRVLCEKFSEKVFDRIYLDHTGNSWSFWNREIYRRCIGHASL